MKVQNSTEREIVIYKAKSGAIELRGDFTHETIWAAQAQMAEMFGVKSPAMAKHIKNIYDDNEFVRDRTCSKMEQVRDEGAI